MKKRLLLLTLSIVLIVAGVNILVRGEYISGMIKDRIVAMAEEELGLDVGMDRFVFNLFPSYVELHGPYVTGWDTKDPGRRLSAKRARVYFGLGALLGRKLYMSRVQVIGPEILVEKYPDGTLNIDPLIDRIETLREEGGGEPGSGAGINTVLKEVVIYDVNLAYTDLADGLAVSVGDGGMDVRFEDGGGVWLGYNFEDIVAAKGGARPFHMQISGETTFKDGRADLSRVKLASRDTEVRLDGRLRPDAIHPEIELGVDAVVDLGLLDTFGVWQGGPGGSVRVKGKVAGTYPDLNGSGDLSVERASLGGVKLENLDASVRFDPGMVTVEGITASVMDGFVEGGVTVTLGGDRIRHSSSWKFRDILTGRFTEPDPALNFIPWYTVSGTADFEGEGLELDTFSGSGRLDVNQYDKPHESPQEWAELEIIQSASADYIFTDERFFIGRGHARSRHIWTDFRGSISIDGDTDLALTAGSDDIGEIAELLDYPYIDGHVEAAAGTVTGNIMEPTIKGRARITDINADGIPLRSAEGDILLSGWKLGFSDFNIEHESGEFVLDGAISFQGENASFYEPYFDASLKVTNADVRPIVAICYDDLPINIKADGVLEFHGNTLDFGATGHLVTGPGDAYGQKIDKGEVSAVLTERDISFPEVIAVKGRDILSADGRIGFDGSFEAKVTSARVELENVDILMDTGLPIKGSASVSVKGSGTFDNPHITAKLGAYDLFLKDVDMGGGTVEAQIDNWVLGGTASILDGKVTLKASLDLDEPYGWRGSLKFDSGRFEPFVRMAYPDLPEDVSIISTGVLGASGSIDGIENERARLEFDEVSATVFGRTMQNTGPVSVTYGEDGIKMKSLVFGGEGLAATVRGGMDEDGQLGVMADLSLDMAAMKYLLGESVDYLDGKLDLSLSVSGESSDPVFGGQVAVRDAGIKFSGFPQRVDEINGLIKLDGGAFTLEEFGAAFGGGRLTGRGRGGLDGWSVDNFSVELDARDVKVRFPEKLVSTVDAELYAEGEGSRMAISGDVTIKKSRYAERIEWKSWLFEFTKKKKDIFGSEPGPLDKVALNVRILGDQTIRVDNNMAKIPVSSDLLVRGTLARPTLLGRLEASSGQVFLRNNAFRLINGVAEFADPTDINPLIDIQAETKVRRYMVRFSLSGTMDKLQIALMSDPPLDDRDILSLLTIGRTVEDIQGHEAAISTGEVASLVTGQLQDAVEERVMRLTGFDRFQIDPYMTSTGQSSGPRLTIGKSLFTEKLYITYSSNLGTSEDQLVRLEYIFNRNFSIVGERDELGRFGADLKLRLEYR